jgi:pimeloyl-ACP methyl ester carboxylesterase
MTGKVRRIRTGQVELSTTIVGEGPPVLLLHGFPDSAQIWRYQAPALAQAGYRVIAPDLRGFGQSDAPTEKAAYQIDHIIEDLLGLLEALGIRQPIGLVGHDWGAAVGWLLCARHPERVARFVALSVGHPGAYRRASLRQKLKGWYILAFQLEGVAERMIAADGFRFLRRVEPTQEDGERWVADLSRLGRLTAALNWYRANFRPFLSARFPPVHVPVLGIYSTGDVALTEDQMTGSAAHVRAEWRYECLPGVGHWLQIERPDETNQLLLGWFEAPSSFRSGQESESSGAPQLTVCPSRFG